MENLNGTESEYLLQSSVEDLHQVSTYWLSEIEFYKTELNFFQDLLDKHCPKINSPEDKKQLDHFQNLPEAVGNEGRPGLVHRLDKNTTGIMVIAKTEHALTHLAKQFFDRTSDRRYQALVWGDVKEDEGRIEGNIWRSHKNRKIMDVFPEEDIGKTVFCKGLLEQ